MSTEFWSWVEAERTARGLSERRLAVVSGLDPSTVCQARQRNSEPSRKVVVALARGLDLPQRILLIELGYRI